MIISIMPLKPSSSFMKVLVLLAVLSLAPVTLYILYTRTGGPPSQKEMQFQRNLRFAFMQGVDAIDLASLAAWPYVKVCALESGLTNNEVNAILGFEYENIAELHWMHLGEYWTLVFVDSEREVSWGMARPIQAVRIGKKDLAGLKLPAGTKGQCITRDGRIEITRTAVPVGESPVTVQLVSTVAE
jgi:hypothetical protein